MADVRWPARTLSELAEIVAYIERDNPIAAVKVRDRLLALGESLSYAPRRGRPLPDGTRQIVTARPYVLRYRMVGQDVVIVGIRHSARRPLA